MEIIRLWETDAAIAARRAIEVLKAGGIVLYPTDTLYGLGVDALNLRAIEKLKELKGRERKKPISVILPTLKHVDQHVVLGDAARLMGERHLPGGLTMVLPARSHIPEELTLNGALGVRIPNDPFVLALAHRYLHPFTATSANLSGLTTGTTVSEIFEQFGSRIVQIDLVIDDGDRSGTSSTVVEFKNGEPRVLREGVLTRVDLGL